MVKACCLSPLGAHESKTNTISKDRAGDRNSEKSAIKNKWMQKERGQYTFARQRAWHWRLFLISEAEVQPGVRILSLWMWPGWPREGLLRKVGKADVQRLLS